MLLVAVAAAAAVAAYWMLALAPKREEAATLSKSIATKQGELGNAKAELAQFEKAKAGYRANYSLVARLGKAVPADDDVRSLLVQLNSAAGRSKVDFRSITVGGGASPAPAAGGAQGAQAPAKVAPPGSAPVGSAGFTAMPFTFSFKGSYFTLGQFFQRLDRFVAVNQRRLDVTGRLMVLNNISLVPDAAGFPKIRASIGATTYMLPTTQESLTAAAATPAAPGAATGTPAAPGASATPAPATTPPTTTAAMGATR
jgi:Tfp pilus assembly protein PilO